jgi:hypothetical protein
MLKASNLVFLHGALVKQAHEVFVPCLGHLREGDNQT